MNKNTKTPNNIPKKNNKMEEKLDRAKKKSFIDDCYKGDLEQIRLAIESDPSLVHAHDGFGNTALSILCIYGWFNIVKYFIEQGCKLDASDLLYYPCVGNRLDQAKYLVQKGVLVGKGSLGWEAVKNITVRWLLSQYPITLVLCRLIPHQLPVELVRLVCEFLFEK